MNTNRNQSTTIENVSFVGFISKKRRKIKQQRDINQAQNLGKNMNATTCTSNFQFGHDWQVLQYALRVHWFIHKEKEPG